MIVINGEYIGFEHCLTYVEELLVLFIYDQTDENTLNLKEYLKYSEYLPEYNEQKRLSLKLWCYFNSYKMDSQEDVQKIIEVSKSLLCWLVPQSINNGDFEIRRSHAFKSVPDLRDRLNR